MGDPRDGFTFNEDGTNRGSRHDKTPKVKIKVNYLMRECYFNATGQYSSDEEIVQWFINTTLEIAKGIE